MDKIRPWGQFGWLFQKMEKKNWTVISCISFEERCIALPMTCNEQVNVAANYLLKVNDPINIHSEEINRLTSLYVSKLNTLPNKTIVQIDLLTGLGNINQLVKEISSNQASVIIDISAMPKRVFLFLIKQLLLATNVVDLVVCYTKPESYKEGQLTNNALPPAALPGFSREKENAKSTTVVVSVGYMGFNLGELLEQAKGRFLKFLFPFPPGSPSYRRNWWLLHQLTQPDIGIDTEIKRVHATDLFGAYDWLRSINFDSSLQIDMIPLGPKPHALAMGLAHLKFDGESEVIYSQPQLYHPEYSKGIKLNHDGKLDITSYCLKKDSVSYLA